MAIIGSAEVEVRADVRKLGKDITDSFDDLNKYADDVAQKMSKSIGDNLKKELDGLTIDLRISDTILHDIVAIEEEIKSLSDIEVDLKLNDEQLSKLDELRDLEVHAELILDTSKAQEQIEELSGQAIDVEISQESADGILQSIRNFVDIPDKDRMIDLDVDISPASSKKLTDWMKEALEDANNIAKKHDIDLNIDSDSATIEKNLNRLLATIGRDLEITAEMGVELDQSDMAQVNDALETLRLYNEMNGIELGVDVNTIPAMVQLKALARDRIVNLIPKVSAKASAIALGTLAGFTGFNLMKEHTKDFIKSLTELDKQLPQTALMLSALSAAVPAAGWGAGALVTLIGDLASLSGLLVPGAAALTAYGAGWFFVNNAFSKTNKKKYIPEITKQLNDLSSTVARDYWKVAEPSYRSFAFKTLPALYQSTKKLNTGMAELSSAFWDSIGAVAQSNFGMKNIKTFTDNASSAMQILEKAIEPAMQGVLGLATIGSSYLPGIAKYIKDIAVEFGTWVNSVEGEAALREWAEDGMKALKDLWSTIVSTVSIFQTLFHVTKAVGFPGLAELADGLRRIDEALSSDAAIANMIVLGTTVKNAFDQIGASLSWIGPVIEQNFGGMVQSIETMGDITSTILLGIGDMFTNTPIVSSFFGLLESFKLAAESFRPAFESIGTIIAVTMDFIGAALEALSPVMTQFFENLAQDAILIKPAFMDMLGIIQEWGPKVMEIVGKVTNKIAEWIGNLNPVVAMIGLAFIGMLPVILPVIGTVLSAISTVGNAVGGITAILSALGTTWGAVWGSLSGIVTPIIGTVTTALSNLASGGIGQIIPRLLSAIPVVGWVVGAFALAFAASEDLRKAVGEFLVNAFETLMAFVQPLIGPIGSLFTTLWDGVMKVGAAIAPAFTGFFNVLNAVMPIVKLLAHLLGTVLGAAISALAGVFSGLFDTVSNVLGSVASTIEGMFNFITELITGLIDVVVALFTGGDVGQAFSDMFSGLEEAAGSIIQGISDTISSLFEGLFNTIGDVFGGILDFILGILEGLDLFPAAQSIIQSLLDGLNGAIQWVIDFFVGLTEAIIQHKGPPEKDATLLTDAGRSIIQSLLDGLMEAVQSIFDFLIDLTQRIVQLFMTFIQGVVLVFQTGWSVLVAIVQTVWNGIVTAIQTIITTIFTIVQGFIIGVYQIFQLGWTALVTIIQTVWNGIITAIQTVITTIFTIVQGFIIGVYQLFQLGWAVLVTIVQTVWNGIIAAIQTVITIIVTVIQGFLTGVVTIFQAGWNFLVTVVTGVWNLIKSIISAGISFVLSIITSVMNTIKTVFTTIWNAINTVITTVWNGIKSFITGAVNAVRSVISSVFNAIRSVISSVMNTIRSIISSVWGFIKSFISSSVNAIRSVISSVFNSVRSTISSVMNSVRSTISSVWNSIKSTVSSAVNNVKSFVSNGFNLLKGIVQRAWDAAVNAVSTSISRMIGFVKGIPGKITSALGNLGNLLRGAGKQIIDGLIGGISDKVGALKNKLSVVTNLIPDWKGPPEKDATLLTNAGQLIMEGFIEGLESRYGAVKNSLQGFTGGLSQTVGTNLSADVGLATSVRETALSDAERRLSYRNGNNSMVDSGDGRKIELHFHQPMANADEIVMVVNRELGRGF